MDERVGAGIQVDGKGEKTRFLPLHATAAVPTDKNNRGKTLEHALTPDGVYKLVKAYSAQLGLDKPIGAHALRVTAATNALDHQADIAKVQEWLRHANIATRIYDHRKTRPDHSLSFKVAY